jgi:hypothetical protein
LAQLAEAYIHFRPFTASDRQIQSLGKYAQRLASDVAGEIYGGDVLVHIELEEGSLRTRMAIAGTIALGVYGAVANYKGFKESIVAMCEDAREFSVDVCQPFTEKAGVPFKDIYRFERRLKTPGKLYRITKRLEKLERSVSDLSPKDVQKELASLRGELNAAAEDLTEVELREVEKVLRRPKLPPPSKWPTPQAPRVAFRREDEQEFPFDGKPIEVPLPHRRTVFQSTTELPSQRRLRLKRHPDDSQPLLED